jgi:hypothetical protein
MTPVSRGMNNQLNYPVFMTPQLFPSAHLPYNPGVTFMPNNRIMNIPKQNFAMPSQNKNQIQIEDENQKKEENCKELEDSKNGYQKRGKISL